MPSFRRVAILALPLLGAVFAGESASPTQETVQPSSIYSSAQEAFQDLLNALPEESLQAALSSLNVFQRGVFESHHRGVEQVHESNPALATKLIVAAVQDLKKRQTPSPPSNSTSIAVPPPQSSSPRPADSSSTATPPGQASSPAPAPPPSSSSSSVDNPAPAPATTTSSADRAVIVNVPQTTVNAQGQTVVETSSVLSQVTASVAVTLTRTNAAGQPVTTTENRPAIIRTTTDSAGRPSLITSAAQFAPTPGEVRTETDAAGRTFVTTYTPAGGKISSVKLITTTGADGRPSTVTSYTFVDPAEQTASVTAKASGKPGLQTGAAVRHGVGAVVAVGGAFAVLF